MSRPAGWIAPLWAAFNISSSMSICIWLHLAAFGCIWLHLVAFASEPLLYTFLLVYLDKNVFHLFRQENVFSLVTLKSVFWLLCILETCYRPRTNCTSNKHERQNVEMKIRTGKCDGERSELYNFKQSWCLSPPPHLEDVGTELSPVDATTLLGISLAWLQIIGFSSENGVRMERIKSDKILESK